MSVQNPPEGYAGVTPYLSVSDADAAIAWYQQALGAELIYRMQYQGKVGHAELLVGGGHLMLADEFPEMDHLGPEKRGGTSVSLLVYVPDAATALERVKAAGGTIREELELKPWGDRSFQFRDPFGHSWTLATHEEDVSWEEVDRRMAAMGG